MFVFFSWCFKVMVGVLHGGRDDRTIAEDDKQKLRSTDLQLRGRKYVEMLDSDTKTNQRPPCLRRMWPRPEFFSIIARLSCGRGERKSCRIDLL